MNFIDLRKKTDKRQTAYCIYGNDRWLKLKAVKTICEAFGITNDSFGIEKLDAPTFERICDACGTGNLFGDSKAVIVENFVFPQGKQCAETIAAISRLANSLKGEDDDSDFGGIFGSGKIVLIFLSETTANFEKTILETVNCNKLDAMSVSKWIVAFGKRQGVGIDFSCARKICDYCLLDMSRVENETQKLIDYGEVSEQSIELLVYKDTEFVVFDLSKHIANRNANAAVALYNGLIAAGEEARGLFGLLYNFYRRAYYVKISEFSNEQLASFFSVKAFAVERAREIAERYKSMQLKRMLEYFDSADRKMKAYLDENSVMIDLIFSLVAS